MLGVALTGRDHSLPGITRIVGPCAHVVPVRVDAGEDFGEQLRHISRAVTEARSTGATMQHFVGAPPAARAGAPAPGAQFVFSYLDFRALGPVTGQTLQLTWDPDGGDMEPPSGTDLFLAARPDHDGLHLTLRAPAAAMTPSALATFAEDVRHELVCEARSAEGRAATPTRRRVLDAALVGYLPAPRELASYARTAASDELRELVRARVFPDGRPRLLEEVSTPRGSSGFVCLPLFADELTGRAGDTLAHDVAAAVAHAHDLGARCVSLAGMIPAHTAYGLGVLRHLGSRAPRVTTGHAATAASVVKTAVAAMAQTRRDVAEQTLAFVGIGSIGRSALGLLLAVGGSPECLVLCDVASRGHQLDDLAREITASGYAGRVTVACSGASLPDAVYRADVIIAAVSGSRQPFDVDRLRPGTIVVDDSFPHAFDPASARARMARHGDVLVVGGGLLTCGPLERRPAEGVLSPAESARILTLRVPDTIASCQLESLLQAERPELPVVHGVVDDALARTYWEALTSAGIDAAPLHLLEHVVTPEYVRAFSRTQDRA